ncbi:hypothetical protein BCQ_PI159 (plasmid) [Bacillus cereus Q1]|uniref:Uncharacterized protein n=1 Tax=Bacillus cereus (strain Q1) TaxID=361100 RepID=B9J698_BACCQ|nr:hypothetical protein BCQ_PI159 [Bacillus cereus Q1]
MYGSEVVIESLIGKAIFLGFFIPQNIVLGYIR